MKLPFLAVVAVCAASCLGASTWKPPSVDRSANRVKTTLNVGLERIGTLVPRSVSEIGESGFMVGCETLDRGFADFEAYKEHPQPSDSCVTRTFTFDGTGRRLEHPVWVDLLTGAVYDFPAENQIEHACGITFVNVPVYDSPCLLAERAALKFQ